MSAAAAFLTVAGVAEAQLTKVVPGETTVMSVSVEAIERSSREVTVKKPDGTYAILYVPASMKAFDTLKVGDKITAKHYENVILQLKPAGQKDVNTAQSAVTRAEGTAGTSARQRTMTVTIAAIDPKVPSITFTGPNNWKYSSRVQDKDALAKVKVGDKVDITWTEALVLALEPAK
jgi:hypothetical protein